MNRKSKFYLALPLIALPFITVVFACMDGGKLDDQRGVKFSGLNTQLPDANNQGDSTRDKLSFYAQAAADSAKYGEQVKNDPYRTAEPQTAIEEKINTIRQKLSLPVDDKKYTEKVYAPSVEPANVGQPVTQTRTIDPDLAAINETLDKLAAIQKPATANKMVKTNSNDALAVRAALTDEESYFGMHDSSVSAQGFFEGVHHTKEDGSFSATIPTSQTLQTGSVVRLQLNQAIVIANSKIPAGAMVFGIVSFENERLFIHIASIRCNGNLCPVDLSVYDQDGIEGIYVPGSLSRDVLKSSADQSLQSVNVLSLDPSIKTQAAIAGIGAVKNILSKKVRNQRATVAAGYRVLLMDNKKENK